MARAALRPGRSYEEIGAAIVAAWFKALPDVTTPGVGPTPIDAAEMTAIFNDILVQNCVAVIDTATTLHIAVPYPPEASKTDLADKLHKYTQNYDKPPGDPNYPKDHPLDPKKHKNKKFSDDMGYAIIFG